MLKANKASGSRKSAFISPTTIVHTFQVCYRSFPRTQDTLTYLSLFVELLLQFGTQVFFLHLTLGGKLRIAVLQLNHCLRKYKQTKHMMVFIRGRRYLELLTASCTREKAVHRLWLHLRIRQKSFIILIASDCHNSPLSMHRILASVSLHLLPFDLVLPAAVWSPPTQQLQLLREDPLGWSAGND